MSRDTEEVKLNSVFTLLVNMVAFFFEALCCNPAQALPLLYPPLRNVIGGLSFSQLISFLKDLSLTSNESLMLACQNKVCSLIVMYVDGSFCIKIVPFFFPEPSSLDCPCCMPSCPKERSSCPLVFRWSPASGTLRPGRLIFEVPIFFSVLIFFCLFLGQTASSRWLGSWPSVHWWSRSSCPQTCSHSSAATWTNARCISWKATWSESSPVFLNLIVLPSLTI